MTTVLFKGQAIKLSGTLPKTGQQAPAFSVVKTDLSPLTLESLRGKKVLLNVFPSVDTGVCSTSVREFNKRLVTYTNCVYVCISMDLPFAHKRFCEVEGLNTIIPTSDFRNHAFGEKYGLKIEEGALIGLLARAVILIDEAGKVLYTELVEDIGKEPNYDAVLKLLSK